MVFGYTKALATKQYLEIVVSNKTVLGVFLLGLIIELSMVFDILEDEQVEIVFNCLGDWIFFEHIFCISYFKYFNCRLLNLFLTPFTLCFPIVHPHSFSFCYVDRFFLFLGWHRNFPPICYKSDDYILSKLIKMLPTSTPKYAYSCHWLVQRASRYSF